MGQITLNREDAERVLANPDADPGARMISALAVALFEHGEHAGEADARSLSICRKLLHLIQCEVYDALDDLEQPADPDAGDEVPA